MWPINYEDPNKLHMSIGIGLLVAAFILILTVLTQSEEKMDSINNEIIYYQNNIFDTTYEQLKLISDKNNTDGIEKNITNLKIELNNQKILTNRLWLNYSLYKINQSVINKLESYKRLYDFLWGFGAFLLFVGYLGFMNKHNWKFI